MKNEQEIEDQSYDDPNHPPQSGGMFLKNGRIGERYLVLTSNRVVKLERIGLGGVGVSFPPAHKVRTISRHTEVIDYNEKEHERFLPKPVVKVDEEE